MQDEYITITLPEMFEEDEERGFIMEELKEQDVTADELLDSSFIEYCALVPDVPPFLALLDFQTICQWEKEMCVTGLIDPTYVYLMDLHRDCEQYHSLPLAGGVEDQNTLVMQAFKILSSESNRFDKKRMEDLDKKSSKN